MNKTEICEMCDNYSTENKCEVESSCKLIMLHKENKRLKAEVKRLKAENEKYSIEKSWLDFPEAMGR